MEGLLKPVQAMVTRLLGFLPNLLGAAVVFGVGFLAARIVRLVITGVLTVAGSERIATLPPQAARLRCRACGSAAGSQWPAT